MPWKERGSWYSMEHLWVTAPLVQPVCTDSTGSLLGGSLRGARLVVKVPWLSSFPTALLLPSDSSATSQNKQLPCKPCLSLRTGWGRGKASACQCRRHRRHGFSPQVGKILGRRKRQPLQCSCLENPRDRGARWATAHAVSELDTA